MGIREIIFRGKRKDNGNWVYGFLADYIAGIKASINPEYMGVVDETNFYCVDPYTVGQYTGLTDKNGKRIFEGDIIRTKKYGKSIGRSNVNGFDIFSVIYSPAVFRIERESPPRVFNFVGNGADYEIIGNINDNPELLVEVSDNDQR